MLNDTLSPRKIVCPCCEGPLDRIRDDVDRTLRRAWKLLGTGLIDAENERLARQRLGRLRLQQAAIQLLLVESHEQYHHELRTMATRLPETIDRLDLAIAGYGVFGPAAVQTEPVPIDLGAPLQGVALRLFHVLREHAYRRFLEDAGRA